MGSATAFGLGEPVPPIATDDTPTAGPAAESRLPGASRPASDQLSGALPPANGQLPGAGISGLTLRFRDAELEQDFDRQWLRRCRPIIRTWSVFGIAIYAGFALLEWLVLPELLAETAAVRYGAVLALFIAAHALTYVDAIFVRHHGSMLTVCLGVAAASFLYMLVRAPFPVSTLYFFMLLLVTQFAQGFIGVRYVRVVTIVGFIYAAHLGVTLLLNPLPPKATALFALVLFASSLVAACSSYHHELNLRREFRKTRLLERQTLRAAELAARAKAAADAKSRFLAMMGHELRTPLNAIIGFSDSMLRGVLGPLQPERYRGYASDIRDSGENLLELINDILDLAKAEDGRLAPVEQVLNLRAAIEAAVRRLKPQAIEAGVAVAATLAADVPDLLVDERMLRQMLHAVLSNAVKFTPAGGGAAVRAFAEADGGVCIEIADTGIGMADADLGTALAPFGQIDSSLARRFPGAGLGLPLARAMAELHGARFAIESAAGEGTRVRIHFPPARSVGAEGA